LGSERTSASRFFFKCHGYLTNNYFHYKSEFSLTSYTYCSVKA
jgi:hypothetical protein